MKLKKVRFLKNYIVVKMDELKTQIKFKEYIKWINEDISMFLDEKGNIKYEVRDTDWYKGFNEAINNRGPFCASHYFSGTNVERMRWAAGYTWGRSFLEASLN